jgi:hypothetical protein
MKPGYSFSLIGTLGLFIFGLVAVLSDLGYGIDQSSESAVKVLPFDLEIKNLSICGYSCVFIGPNKIELVGMSNEGITYIPKGTALKIVETSNIIGGPTTYEADLSAQIKPGQPELDIPEDYQSLKPPVYVVARSSRHGLEFTNGTYVKNFPKGTSPNDFPVNSHWLMTFNPRNGEITSFEYFDPFPQDYKRRRSPGYYPAPDPYLHERIINGRPESCSPSSYHCF